MPGAGKSSVGVMLAQLTARDFVDTDILIQSLQERTLQEIVDSDGYTALRMIEEKVLIGLHAQNSVIATGGSAVYSDCAMAHLKSAGVVIFLEVELPVLESRIHDFSSRGLAKRADQGLADLYLERFTLYRKYADVTIKATDLTQKEVCTRIITHMRRIISQNPKVAA